MICFLLTRSIYQDGQTSKKVWRGLGQPIRLLLHLGKWEITLLQLLDANFQTFISLQMTQTLRNLLLYTSCFCEQILWYRYNMLLYFFTRIEKRKTIIRSGKLPVMSVSTNIYIILCIKEGGFSYGTWLRTTFFLTF